MDDLIKEFLVESYENLDRLDRDFVALETDPTAADKLASIFRTIHTIKGTSGCLGFGKLERVAHVGENLLSRLRDAQLIIDTEITTALLQLVDAIREILGAIENTGLEGINEYQQLKQTLVTLNARPSVGTVVDEAATNDAGDAALLATHGYANLLPAAAAAVEHEPLPPTGVLSPEEFAALSASLTPAVADAVAEVAPTPVANAPAPAAVHAEPAAEPAHEAAKPAGNANGESLAGNAIRVDVVLLDKLMNLVGELVLARNQVLQFNATQNNADFVSTAQRLNLITTELQEGVMKTRMQPIGNLWGKFPRIVRDVANTCGKKVRLEMEGKETELDKTIIEAIKDPLTHVIRNSVDHGVERPEKRLAAGKPEEGCLSMRAFHEGGQVNIEITDDGGGIDPERVKRKALEKGLITAEQAARMGERDAINLIFAPGFSTAEVVSNVSGRGVGMDVVKTNVEKIGGTVDVKSKVGQGTTLRIKIPLTLAIIPALIVTSGGERFAIPQVSLLELVRIDDENDRGGDIEMIGGAPLYRLRGNLLPLVYLNSELRLPTPTRDANVPRGSNIVVLRGGDRQFGLVVDDINDTEEIVVKPLGKQLKGINVLAGATIMGDGKVALILDVMGLAQRANILAPSGDAAARAVVDASKQEVNDGQMLLLFNVHGDERMAIPLSTVARLEEFAWGSVERAGNEHVVQYRGQIMPIINVADELETRRAALRGRTRRATAKTVEPAANEKIHVVVYSQGDRNVGLHVDRILDVVEQRVEVQRTGARAGVIGTAVIKDRVTELLDIESFAIASGKAAAAA